MPGHRRLAAAKKAPPRIFRGNGLCGIPVLFQAELQPRPPLLQRTPFVNQLGFDGFGAGDGEQGAEGGGVVGGGEELNRPVGEAGVEAFGEPAPQRRLAVLRGWGTRRCRAARSRGSRVWPRPARSCCSCRRGFQASAPPWGVRTRCCRRERAPRRQSGRRPRPRPPRRRLASAG